MSRHSTLSGLAGIALLDVGWFWDPTPPIDWSDRHLDAYFATHSDTNWLIAAVLQLLAVPLLWHFAGAVRDRLAAGGASARTARVAGESARGFAITVLACAVCYAVMPFTGLFTDVSMPDAEIYRFWNAGTFAVYIPVSTVFGVALIGAVCAAAFRSRAVPVWLGVVGVPLALATLGNFFLPMAGLTLWFIVAPIALAAVRPRSAQPAAVPTPVPATL